MLRFASFYDMFAAVPMGFPIVFVAQFVDADTFAGGYVDEFVFTEIDAAVGGAFFISAEKDKVAGDKLFL